MRLGLIRHFEVTEPWPRGWRTAAELHAWRARYEQAAVHPVPVTLGDGPWEACLCSPLARAVRTAQAVFPGPVETTPLLREAEFACFQTGRLRLPVWVWGWVFRTAWLTGHRSQRAERDAFLGRVRAAADLLEARRGYLLVVSHAGMMVYLGAELRRRGFVGPRLRMPAHAKLYAFAREAGQPAT